MSLDLSAIRARVAKATPGPWVSNRTYVGVSLEGGLTIPRKIADAEFIAHAREDIPALLDEIERLRTLLDASAEALTRAIERLPPGGC